MKKTTKVTGLIEGTEYQFRVVSVNENGSSDPSNVVVAAPLAESNTDVTWADLVGVSVNGNTVTKTAGSGWGNGGAASVQSFSGDGAVLFQATELLLTKTCGLSGINVDANYNSIEYLIDLYKGLIYVFEKGVNKGSFGAYQVGDEFCIERQGTAITYKKNGVAFYTSTVPSVGGLMADVSIYSAGGVISNVRMLGVIHGVPSIIEDLEAEAGVGGVDLEWSFPGNGGSRITEQVVQYGTVESGLFDNFVSIPC